MSRAEERVFRIALRRDGEAGESVADLFLPVIAEPHQVPALDPEQANIAIGIRLLEADPDPAAAMKQREVAVRKVVDILQKVRHKDILQLHRGRGGNYQVVQKCFGPSGSV